MKNSIWVLIILFCYASCKTVKVSKQTQRVPSSSIELGVVGEKAANLEVNIFETVSIPNFSHKIKLSSKVYPFSKSTYAAYEKATNLQGKKGFIVPITTSLLTIF